MEIDINLLVKKNNYYRIEKLFQRGRRLTIFLGAFAVVLLAFIFILQNSKKREIDALAVEKTALETELAQRVEMEKKIKLLGNKSYALNEVLKDAPPYASYYQRLEKYIPIASSEGTLKKISFNSPNVVAIEIDFPDILALTKFLGVVESKEFLDEFESIRFSNILFANASAEALTLSVHLSFNDEAQN